MLLYLGNKPTTVPNFKLAKHHRTHFIAPYRFQKHDIRSHHYHSLIITLLTFICHSHTSQLFIIWSILSLGYIHDSFIHLFINSFILHSFTFTKTILTLRSYKLYSHPSFYRPTNFINIRANRVSNFNNLFLFIFHIKKLDINLLVTCFSGYRSRWTTRFEEISRWL